MAPEYMRYGMIIEWSDEDQAYVVTIPELPGCQTHGYSYEEAVRHGIEVMKLWIAARRESGRPIPAPRGRAMHVTTTFPTDVRWLAPERVPA